MTAVEKYTQAIKNYKEIGGSIDDAIILAETLLQPAIDMENKQKELSDEQINQEAKRLYDNSDKEYYAFFMGAMFYREQIKK